MSFISSAAGAVTLDGRSGGLGNAADKRIFGLARDLSDVILVAARYGPGGTVRRIVALINQQAGMDGVARGVYTTLRGTTYPQLYYLPDGGGTTLRSAMLSRALPDHVEVPSLQPGDYTLIAHPHSPAQPYRGSRRSTTSATRRTST